MFTQELPSSVHQHDLITLIDIIILVQIWNFILMGYKCEWMTIVNEYPLKLNPALVL